MLTKIKYKFITALLLIFILMFCYWLWSSHFKHPFTKNQTSGMRAVPVTVMTIQKQPIDLQKSLPGRIVPYEVAELRPQVTGILNNRFFEEGSFVNKGDQLYQIDPAPYQAAYNSAQANLMKAKANLQLFQVKASRAEKLIKTNTISVQDYDDVMAQFAQAKADVGVAQAALEAVKINLDYTQVHAPISGRIGKSELTKGALVTANQPTAIARITQLDPIYVDLALPMHDFKMLHLALSKPNTIILSLFLDNKHKTYKHKGKIQFTDITVNETTNSVLIRSLFPNPEQTLLPGLFVNADLQLKAIDAILIPQKAVIHNPNGSASVWLVNNKNIVDLKPITIDQTIGDQWLVKDGILEGDKIVLTGVQKLKPGTLVSQDSIKKEGH